ncbi:4579_t:CDS:2, partial [Ambispora leptoticha]
QDKTITFDNKQLSAITNGIPFKYLGAWFSTNRKPTLVQKEIIAKAHHNFLPSILTIFFFPFSLTNKHPQQDLYTTSQKQSKTSSRTTTSTTTRCCKYQHLYPFTTPGLSNDTNHIQTYQMILALHTLELQTSRNGDNWPLPKEFIGTPINQILLNHPRALYLKEKLNKHNVFSIEQFLNTTSTELLDLGSNNKLYKSFISSFTAKSLYSNYCNWTHNKKGWMITNKLVIGRIYNSLNETLKTQHYILQPDNTIIACQGCSLKNHYYRDKYCYFNATKPFYNLQVDCKKRTHIDLNDFKKALVLNSAYIPLLSNITTLPALAKPLCAFTNPPIVLWDTLTKTNFKAKTLTLTMT